MSLRLADIIEVIPYKLMHACMHVCDSEPIIVDFPVLYNNAFNIIVTVQTRYTLEASYEFHNISYITNGLHSCKLSYRNRIIL